MLGQDAGALSQMRWTGGDWGGGGGGATGGGNRLAQAGLSIPVGDNNFIPVINSSFCILRHITVCDVHMPLNAICAHACINRV